MPTHTVTKLEVALLYQHGVPRADISLYTDNANTPGTALRTWRVNNVTNTDCCGVVTVKDANGIQLHAGQMYWVVVKSDKLGKDTILRWANNTTDMIHVRPFAQYCSSDHGGSSCGADNDKWLALPYRPEMAFAVYGPD